jgi:hypothetical protein
MKQNCGPLKFCLTLSVGVLSESALSFANVLLHPNVFRIVCQKEASLTRYSKPNKRGK